MDNKTLVIALAIVIIAVGVVAFSAVGHTENTPKSNVTNSTNATNVTNATNAGAVNSTAKDAASPSKSQALEYTQGKADSKDVHSDIYSRWDTDGDGILSSGEIDVHDRALGQGNYYEGHDNMRDSEKTSPY